MISTVIAPKREAKSRQSISENRLVQNGEKVVHAKQVLQQNPIMNEAQPSRRGEEEDLINNKRII